MGATPVRGVMFDLGGTLTGYSSEMGAATGAALSRLGFDPKDSEVVSAMMHAAIAASQDYAEKASYLHRDLFRDQFARTAVLLGAEADAELLDWFEAENCSNIIEHLRPKPDAVEVLTAIRDRGLYCSVVSNADDDFLGPNLERHGLGALVQHWTSSEEAGSRKPDPAIYRLALEKAGLTAEEVLFVGDSLQHDIVGAVAMGMRSALVSNGLGAAPFSHGMDGTAAPDVEVQELRELLPILDRLAEG